MKDFLYFIQKEDGRFLQVVNDTVSATGTPAPLKYTPDGWLDIELKRIRSAKYFAIERTFSAPLMFVNDGGRILKHHFYITGPETKLFLVIAERRLYAEPNNDVIDQYGNAVLDENGNPLVGEQIPEYYYYYSAIGKWEIDFSQYSHEGPKVKLNLVEGGAVKLLKAFENTKYEIPITLDNATIIRFDGLKIHQKATYLVTETATTSEDIFGGHTLSLPFVSTEAVSSIGAVSQERKKTGNNVADLWNADTQFLTTGAKSTEVTLEWDFNLFVKTEGITPAFGTSIFLQLHVLQSNNVRLNNVNIDQKGGGDPALLFGLTHNFKGSYSLSVPANCRCVLYMSAGPGSIRDFIYFNYSSDPGSFKIDYNYTHPATYCRALRPYTLFTELCKKIGIAPGPSAVLEKYKHLLVISGDAIRQFEVAAIKTSLADFYKSFNTVLCIGMGIVNGKLIIEEKKDFVKYSNPIDLGICSGLAVRPATDLMFNTIKIGYPDQDYEDVNGRYEFNTTHIYTTPVTRISKELDLVSVYRADSYGIELTRINLEGRTTTDDAADNDTFFVVAEKTLGHEFVPFPYHELDRGLNPYTTGLLDPSAFNVWLSPKQCLYRNSPYIRSCFYKQDHEAIKFQTADKNSSVVIAQPGAPRFTENGDFEISAMLKPLFLPIVMEFENKVPVDIIEVLKTDPYRCYLFTNDGVTYVGLPQEDAVKPGRKSAQQFTVLSSVTNDLTPLITYNG